MMHRVDTPTAGTDVNGAGKSGFIKGNAPAGVKSTRFSPEWCNAVQEEIAGVIESTGVQLAKPNNNQLVAAIAASGIADMAFMAGMAANGAAENLAAQTYGLLIAARALVITGDVAAVATVPVGAAILIDVTVGGVSIYQTKPSLAAATGAYQAGTLTHAAGILVPAGAVIKFALTQVGSATAGAMLAFTLKARPATAAEIAAGAV